MPEGERIGWGEGNKDQVTKSVLSGVVAAAPLATSKMRWATAVIVGGQTLAEVAQIVAENSLKGMGQFAVEHPDQAPFVKAAMTIPGLTYGVATGIKAGLAGAQALDEVAWYAPVPALGGASVWMRW